jgi:hypothetical protein
VLLIRGDGDDKRSDLPSRFHPFPSLTLVGCTATLRNMLPRATAAPVICGAGAAISASANRGADRAHSLGPVATAGRPLAPMENTPASASGTHRARSQGGNALYGRQRPWTLASRPEQTLSVGLSNAHFKSLGLPSLIEAR